MQSSIKSSSAIQKLFAIARDDLNVIRKSGNIKTERVISKKEGNKIKVNDSSKPLINFASNNYLGLSNHPEIISVVKDTLDEYGMGMNAARYLCGTQSVHKSLEKKIASFHEREDALLYTSCYDANVALFSALWGKEDCILSDSLNHASVIDGIRLSRAAKIVYDHLDMEELESNLMDTQNFRQRAIVTNGVFSMNGNIAPLDLICHLANKYNAVVVLDDCHATGIIGRTGRGTDELHNVQQQIPILNSTIAKALGSAVGGYTTGPKEVIDLLRNKSRPYLFSTSLSVCLAASGNKAMEVIENNPGIITQLTMKTKYFRQRMKEVGFDILGVGSPIIPVMIGDASVAKQLAKYLLKKGIYVIPVTYPVVEKDKARIRVQLSNAHSNDELTYAIEAFAEAGNRFQLIPQESTTSSE